MFTGIVEEQGSVLERTGGRFVFSAAQSIEDAKVGGSLAVNGCCLTVVEVGPGWWRADVVDETLRRTNLAQLSPGDQVNLERPVRAGDRLGGHLVQGHVDAVGPVLEPAPSLRVGVPPSLLRYIVEKGSITVDGCSLTVVDVDAEAFGVAVVPHTAAVTTLGGRAPGDSVNIEVDVLARYVERLMRRD